MSNVIPLPCAVTAEHLRAHHAFGAALEAAITAAKDVGVPQGLLVAVLHALAHRETARLVDDAP